MKINLILNYYKDKVEDRNLELLTCFVKNLNNDYIKGSLQLNQYINPNANDFHLEFVERFQIVPNEELLKAKKINFKLLDFDE